MKRGLWLLFTAATACGTGVVGELPPAGEHAPPLASAGEVRFVSATTGVSTVQPVSLRGELPAGPGGPDEVKVIVAQGLMGRTMLSCDDGRTWRDDRSFDTEGHEMVCGDTTPVRCGSSACKLKQADGSCTTASPCDCLHHPGYAKGVAIAKGQVLANFGWGHPGILLRSLDGAAWRDPVHFDASYLFPNVAFGAGRFVHFSSQPRVSDDGLTWRDGGFANFNGPGQGWTSPRAFDFVPYGAPGEGRFIGVIDGDLIRVSADRGQTWTSPDSVPAGCGDGIGNAQAVLAGNGVAVLLTSTGQACRSGDGGRTWTLHRITSGDLNPWGVFAGGEFLAFGGGQRFSSADAITWRATPMNGSPQLGVVGVSLEGTLVAVNSVWDGYEAQRMLRSTDRGLTWTALSDAAFTRGHAISRFGAGTLSRASGACR